MSFSSEMKEALSQIANLNNKELVKYELLGYLISNNTICDQKQVCYSTVNEFNINRFSKLLSNMNILDFKIEIKGKTFKITFPTGTLGRRIWLNIFGRRNSPPKRPRHRIIFKL